MHDVVLVAERDSLEQHEHVALHLRLGERLLCFANHLRKVGQHVLEDQHEAVAVREDVTQANHLQQPTQINVLPSLFLYVKRVYQKQDMYLSLKI